jgi:hypothetical protein
MEEVLDAAFIADEPEALVNEEACDCAGRHTRSPPFRTPGDIPGALNRDGAPQRVAGRRDAGPVEVLSSPDELENRASLGTFWRGSQANGGL